VNGSQLYAVGTALNTSASGSAAGLGGGAQWNATTGAWTGPTYNVNGVAHDNVGDALGAVNESTNTLGTKTAKALGGGSTYTPGQGVSDPTYRIQGANYNNVGSALGAVDNSLTNLNYGLGVLGANVSSLSNRVDGNQREARQGIAMAASMAQAPMPSAAGKTTWKFNNAIYKGYAATSLSLSHRLPTAVPVALTGGVAMGFRNSTLFTAGLQGEF